MAFETIAEGEGQGRKIGIEMEDENEPADVTKAEGSTRTKTTTPPTLAELLKNPIAIRRYVTKLADATPQAPPDLHGEAFQNWQYRYLLTATLNYLVTVFQDEDNPKENAYLFYQAWLIVNNTDYKDSPFMSFSSAKRLFKHESKARRMYENMAAGRLENARAVSGKRKRGEGEEDA